MATPELNPANPTAAPTLPSTETNNNPGAAAGLGPKRQRRPSVRLGDLGEKPRRRSWTHPAHHLHLQQKPTSSSKTRPLTNLVLNHSNNNNDGSSDSNNGKLTTTKRPRTNLRFAEEEEEDNNEGFSHRDFNPEGSEEDESGDNDDTWHTNSNRRSASTTSNRTEWVGLDESIRKWLVELGLGRYAAVFEIHEVDDEVLPHLTLDDLKDMGISAVGSRRKLFSAILKLRKGLS